jgi:AraC-like DNA-binding protein
MRYAEQCSPPALQLLAPAIWTLAPDQGGGAWIEHEATPDGCVELIRRHSGRSVWRREQPRLFATGLGAAPVRFGFSGDAAFTAVRLWPWAWEALGGAPCPGFVDDWIEVGEDHPLAGLLADDPGKLAGGLAAALAMVRVPAIAPAILSADSVGGLRRATGLPPRRLQRWFAAHIGLSPRCYLRVIRFRGSLRALGESANLAEHAAEHGYADQAHMAREFRRLAGTPPSDARRRMQGPFL